MRSELRLNRIEQQIQQREEAYQQELKAYYASLSDAELAELLAIVELDIAVQMAASPDWKGHTAEELAQRLHDDDPQVKRWIDRNGHQFGKEPHQQPSPVTTWIQQRRKAAQEGYDAI